MALFALEVMGKWWGDAESSSCTQAQEYLAGPGWPKHLHELVTQFLINLPSSLLAKILGKVGESLSRICCVRPPMERFTFVGM